MALAYIREFGPPRRRRRSSTGGARPRSAWPSRRSSSCSTAARTEGGWMSAMPSFPMPSSWCSAPSSGGSSAPHDEPVVDFAFFKSGTFNGALLNNFLPFMAMMGSIYAIPIFAQTFLGYDATQSGLLFIPMGLCIPLSQRCSAAISRPRIIRRGHHLLEARPAERSRSISCRS